MRADARSVPRALSATVSRLGGPNNAVEPNPPVPNNATKLNASFCWALLDVREAGKESAALTPCPVFP